MMTTQEQYIAKIKQLVINRYGSNISSADDCAALSDAVERSVGVRIDMPTLQLLFSRGRTMTPRLMVLSTLAKYVGYEDWSDFCASNTVDVSDEDVKIPIRRRWGVIIATVVGVAVILIGALFVIGDDGEPSKSTPATTPYDLIVEDVAKRYIALTDEECIALRIHDGTNSLALEEQTKEAIAIYKSVVVLSIAEDIRNAAAEKGVDIDDVDVEASAAEIKERCVAILHELIEE